MALAGRLRSVPGIGPKTEARILERLASGTPRARRGLVLNRARALVEEIAGRLGGAVAGDPRRWADTCIDLAVVVPSASGADDRCVRGSWLDRHRCRARGRRAVGVTVEGVSVVLVVARPEAFGTELLRTTGTRDYVDALEPLPEAPGEEGVYAALGIPGARPSSARRRIAASHRCSSSSPTSAATSTPHDVVGRQGVGARDGSRGTRSRLRVHRHLRSHRERPRRAGARRRRRAAAGRGDRARQRAARSFPHPSGNGGRHSPRRKPRPARRRPHRARLGATKPSRGTAREERS